MTARLLTPSKITAWLSCEHALTLQHQLESGAIAPVAQPFGSFARLLANKGLEHEAACLAAYRAQGLSVLEIPDRKRSETFAEWVERVGDPFAEGHDVIYQLPFAHDGVRGVADFVLRVVDEETGQVSYEPVDAKLAHRHAACTDAPVAGVGRVRDDPDDRRHAVLAPPAIRLQLADEGR